MEKLRMSIPLCAKIEPYKEIPISYNLNSNSQFTICKCYVLGLGKNQNLSYFSKEAVEKALPSLFNVPVVGHIINEDNGNKYMGSHDVVVTIDSDGIDIKSVCIPYGVVPVQDSMHFENVTNQDGSIGEYLVCDVVLWTGRFPELMDAAYSNDFYFNQSMEITANEYADLEADPRYTEVINFEFNALCLLGKADDKNSKEHTEPCFPMARVVPYEYDLKTKSFTDMLSQLKYELTSCFIQEISKEGGNKEGMPNEVIDSILAEYSIERDALEFEVTDDMTEEDLRARLGEIANESPEFADEHTTETGEFDVGVEDSADVAVMPDSDVSSNRPTYMQKLSALMDLFHDDVEYAEDGSIISETFYWVCDFSDEYVYVERCHYDANGASNIHGRYPIAFNESDKTVSIVGDFEEMVMRWLTGDEIARLDSMSREYEELVQFRNDRLEADRRSEMDAVIEEFSDIRNAEEFADIRENPYKFNSVDELRTACFAVRGRIAQPKVKQNFGARMPIGDDDCANDNGGRYGDLFDRFGHRK